MFSKLYATAGIAIIIASFAPVGASGPIDEVLDLVGVSTATLVPLDAGCLAQPEERNAAQEEACSAPCTVKDNTIAMIYVHISYGEPCGTVSGGPCTGGAQWQVDNLKAYNWNDVISSAEIYAPEAFGCATMTLYEHAHGNGLSHDCSTDCNYVGSGFNDLASSLAICGSSTCPWII